MIVAWLRRAPKAGVGEWPELGRGNISIPIGGVVAASRATTIKGRCARAMEGTWTTTTTTIATTICGWRPGGVVVSSLTRRHLKVLLDFTIAWDVSKHCCVAKNTIVEGRLRFGCFFPGRVANKSHSTILKQMKHLQRTMLHAESLQSRTINLKQQKISKLWSRLLLANIYIQGSQ